MFSEPLCARPSGRSRRRSRCALGTRCLGLSGSSRFLGIHSRSRRAPKQRRSRPSTRKAFALAPRYGTGEREQGRVERSAVDPAGSTSGQSEVPSTAFSAAPLGLFVLEVRSSHSTISRTLIESGFRMTTSHCPCLHLPKESRVLCAFAVARKEPARARKLIDDDQQTITLTGAADVMTQAADADVIVVGGRTRWSGRQRRAGRSTRMLRSRQSRLAGLPW